MVQGMFAFSDFLDKEIKFLSIEFWSGGVWEMKRKWKSFIIPASFPLLNSTLIPPGVKVSHFEEHPLDMDH